MVQIAHALTRESAAALAAAVAQAVMDGMALSSGSGDYPELAAQ
jgi:hypothetical protein